MIKDKHELAARLMILVQYQVCFARSLFERPGANKKGLTRMRKQSLSHEESEFLYLVFDCLHNVPELVSRLMQPDEKDAAAPDAFLLQLAAEKLEFLVQLTADSEKRRSCGIRDTDRILSWTHCGLSRIKDTAGTCSKLLMLLLQGNTACRTGRSPSGHCGSAFYCSAPYDCCGQCPEKCNTGEKENFTETTGLRLYPQTVLQQRNIGKMAKEKNSINTEKNLPVATFSKEISKDFFSEKEEHYYFHLKDTIHEFAMGLKEILLCVHFAEDEGLIPKASYEWWSFLYSTYNVPHEPYSQNYKEGFHNGFWNAIELIKKQKNINTYIQKIEEKYSGLDSSEFLGAIDIEWEADSDIE